MSQLRTHVISPSTVGWGGGLAPRSPWLRATMRLGERAHQAHPSFHRKAERSQSLILVSCCLILPENGNN